MNDVFLIKSGFFEKAAPVIKKHLGDVGGMTVAVKCHMGEYGNIYHIRPAIVGRVVGILKGMGARTFVFDTLPKYKGSRDTTEKYMETAKRNGFTEEVVGCGIDILDDFETIKTENLDAEIPKKLLKADAMVVVSHGKGHWHCAGFGGAIKNIGMGCARPAAKKKMGAGARP